MPDLNPFDDIVDAIKGLLTAGSVENYVADKTSIGGAKNEAAMDAYKTIKDVAGYGTTAADIAYTGGLLKPATKLLLAQNMVASKETKAKAIKNATKELSVAAAGAAAGYGLSAVAKNGLMALAKKRAAKELESVLGVHHSWTPGIKEVNVGIIPTGQMGATAADQIPGYSYMWAGEFPVKGIDETTGLPWSEIRKTWRDFPNQLQQVGKLQEAGLIPNTIEDAVDALRQGIQPFTTSTLTEIPFQYKHKFNNYVYPVYDKGYTYIVKTPGNIVSMDENLLKQMPPGVLPTGVKVKGPLKVLDEIPTGEINDIQYPYGVDANALFEKFLQRYIEHVTKPVKIIQSAAGPQAMAVDAARIAALAKLKQLNER